MAFTLFEELYVLNIYRRFHRQFPGVERGGRPTDGANFLRFLRELKQAIAASGVPLIVSMTAPANYWYLQHFPIFEMQYEGGSGISLSYSIGLLTMQSLTIVDWINAMTMPFNYQYDLVRK